MTRQLGHNNGPPMYDMARAFRWAVGNSKDLTPNAKLVAHTIALMFDGGRDKAWPSYKWLEAMSSLGRASITRAIQELRESFSALGIQSKRGCSNRYSNECTPHMAVQSYNSWAALGKVAHRAHSEHGSEPGSHRAPEPCSHRAPTNSSKNERLQKEKAVEVLQTRMVELQASVVESFNGNSWTEIAGFVQHYGELSPVRTLETVLDLIARFGAWPLWVAYHEPNVHAARTPFQYFCKRCLQICADEGQRTDMPSPEDLACATRFYNRGGF